MASEEKVSEEQAGEVAVPLAPSTTIERDINAPKHTSILTHPL